MISMNAIDAQIDLNYDYFRRHLSEFIATQAGRIALLRNGALVEFFDDVGCADREGASRFDDGLYSLQPVIDEPVDLGYFSHAGG
jgi:hypothetical protein